MPHRDTRLTGHVRRLLAVHGAFRHTAPMYEPGRAPPLVRRSRRRPGSRRPGSLAGVMDDRVDDGVPVGSVDAVAGAVQRQQRSVGDLSGERLAVCEWEERVVGAVDDQRGRDDRGEIRVGLLVVRKYVVVLQ